MYFDVKEEFLNYSYFDTKRSSHTLNINKIKGLRKKMVNYEQKLEYMYQPFDWDNDRTYVRN